MHQKAATTIVSDSAKKLLLQKKKMKENKHADKEQCEKRIQNR